MDFLLKLSHYECTVRVNENITGEPDYKTGRHCNAEHELFIILSGEAKMSANDREYAITAGQALLIPPSNFHSMNSGSDNLQYIVIPFGISSYARVKDSFLCEVKCICLSKDTLITANKLLLEISKRPPFLRERTEARVTLILSEIFSEVIRPSARVFDEAYNVNGRLTVIDDFFEKEFTKYGTAELLAKKLHLSVRQLNRVLLENYGMGFREKLMLARMDRAAWLLRTSRISIQRISEEVGYLSQNSFFKAFSSHFGLGPSKYRKEFLQNEH